MTLCGLLLLDKAAGITSHTAVATLRKILNIDRIGHLGTLDPFATGLLPILVGGATRLSDEMISGKKQYLFTILLGIETDTLDASGQVVEQAEVPLYYKEKINNILPQFIGNIEQVPPVYSALKMNGKPLYEYMRSTGKLPNSIETKKRNVFIDTLEIVSVDENLKTITLRTLCEKGTYVRSLARDIAKAIDTRGHCVALRRELVAPWSVDDAVSFSPENQLDVDLIKRKMISPEQMLPHLSKMTLGKIHLKSFSSGNVISLPLEETIHQYPFISKISLNDNKLFVCIEDEAMMFLSDLEIHASENIVKIKPKKKII